GALRKSLSKGSSGRRAECQWTIVLSACFEQLLSAVFGACHNLPISTWALQSCSLSSCHTSQHICKKRRRTAKGWRELTIQD
ncbi:unnamed protein product, partial [Gulo gulo]